ncbi:hypothetical protein SAM19_01106 [Brevibacillus laterosporus]|nr:hypothetical protein [Brevibacillus laterosporus]
MGEHLTYCSFPSFYYSSVHSFVTCLADGDRIRTLGWSYARAIQAEAESLCVDCIFFLCSSYRFKWIPYDNKSDHTILAGS